MRLLPLQIAMYQLCGRRLPFVERNELTLQKRIVQALQNLVERTGQDFGYDISAWHDYLCTCDGYKWSNKHLSIASTIRETLTDSKWLEAVAEIQRQETEKR